MARALLTSRGCGRWPAVLLTLVWALAMASPALAVTFTVDTLITEGDTTYDGEDVVVDGCTVTINGAHAFNSLQVINGGVVTHSAYAAPTVYRLDLAIVEDVTVDTDSRIDVSGQGYLRDQGPGAGASASSYGAGGGYGGKGGDSTQASGGSAYGSITEPADLGSGGGRSTYYSTHAGGAGGGAARISVGGTLTVNGTLAANGMNGQGATSYAVGGGSGGSLWLTVGTLAGAGAITANGGNSGHANAGGGGGGRIAVYADEVPFEGTLSACGGTGHIRGGAGTLYTKLATDTDGTLLIDNCGSAGALTPSIATETFDRITVQRAGRLDFSGTELMTTPQLVIGNAGRVTLQTTATFGQVQIEEGGLLTHHATQTGFELTVTGDLTIAAGGALDVSGQGYLRDQGPGAGASASSYGAGGGYGGKGGDSTQASGGSAYGSITEPADLGSGGGRSTYYSTHAGGAGGGAARISVGGTLTVNGTLAANGADGEGSGSYGVGGGSGGSVWLTVGSLAGAGAITANGGNGGHANAGGGGGGRIAVYADSIPFEGTLSACGGTGHIRGGAGTLYTKLATDTEGTLLIDNCGTAGALTPSIAEETFDRITVRRGGRLDFSGTELMTAPQLVIGNAGRVTLQTAATFGQVQIEEGGLLTHHATQTGFELTVTGDLTIAAGGALDVSGQGYPRDQGPGAGASASSYGAGGGYGGKGGDSTQASGGSAYGSITEPADLGSGGGRSTLGSNYAGGAGGGAVRLNISGTLTVNGTLAANGMNGQGATSYGVGGGSGGSLWLTVGTLAGAGAITANGGNSGHANAGGGGGGRIAVYADEIPFEGTLSACGGTGHIRGGAGTLYTKLATDTEGTLLIDNCGMAGALTPSLAAETFDRITVQRGGRLDFSGTELMTAAQLVIGNAGRVTLQTSATFGQVQIEEGGLLTHHATQTGFELTVTGDLTIAAGGALDVSGQGHPRDSGPGAGGSSTNYYGAGGGYGGKGGDCVGASGGAAYGSITEPADLGSGGGRAKGYPSLGGGAGGGLVHLAVGGALTVNGTLAANGINGQGTSMYGVGGGSGGSIWLTVGTLAGSGTITANGGKGGHNNAGGGAGGRIAIYHGGMESFDPARITVTGGVGYQHGEDGTIFLSSINPPKALSHEPAGWLTAPVSHVDVTFDSFMKPWTFGADDVLITLPGGGTISQAEITVSHVQGRVFRIAFPEQSAQDLYTVRVGPHIVNLYDQEMDQNGNGTPGEEWGDAYVGTFSIDTTPLLIEQAKSRKTHGTGGAFDVDVLASTGVECRANGPTLLVVVFNQEIEGVDGLDLGDVSVTNATATSVAITGTTLEIGLSGAVDGSLVTVSFPGIVDVTEQYPVLVQDTLCFGALKGDANGDKSVNIFDLVTVRNALNQPVTAANFRGDVTADNAINIFDLVTVRNNLNKAITGSCP